MTATIPADAQAVLRAALKCAPTPTVEGLRELILADDGRMIRGLMTLPECRRGGEDWPCEGCCPLAYLAVGPAVFGLPVGQVEEFTSQLTVRLDMDAGDACFTGPFLRWIDDEPAAQTSAALLAEVEAELAWRA